MCSFFASSFTAEGVISVNIVFVMATFARGSVWVDGESKFAADAEKEVNLCSFGTLQSVGMTCVGRGC